LTIDGHSKTLTEMESLRGALKPSKQSALELL